MNLIQKFFCRIAHCDESKVNQMQDHDDVLRPIHEVNIRITELVEQQRVIREGYRNPVSRTITGRQRSPRTEPTS